MEKILVIRYDTIGDSIFVTAFLRELRKNLPDAQIDIMVGTQAEPMFENCPYINNIVKFYHAKYKYFHIFKYISLFKQYDTVFFLKHARTYSIFCKLANVKNRIGFDVKRNKFLTFKVPYNEDKSEIDCYLSFLSASGLKAENNNTELWINEESLKSIQQKIDNSEKPIAVIQAFSRDKAKNWISDYWIDVIKYLSEERNALIYYLGSKKDIKSYNQITKRMKEKFGKTYGKDLSGQLSINESVALVSLSKLVISIDSCAAHMAAAFKIPQIFIHGTTSLKRWKPRNENCLVASKNFPCSPCVYQTNAKYLCKKKIPQCMSELTPGDIIKLIEDIKIENSAENISK